MHEIVFAKSAMPERVTVLNLLMRPYSIGHELLLQGRTNPLVTYSRASFRELPEKEQRGKLFSAAFICERTWTENQRPIRWMATTIHFRRHLATLAEVEKFQDYRAAGMQEFPTVPMPKVPHAPYHYFGAPEMARLLLFVTRNGLHRELGFETPCDFPLGLARQLYLTQTEVEGNQWVQNFQDAEIQAEREEAEAKGQGSQLVIGDKAVQAAIAKLKKEHPEAQVPL